MPIWIRKTTKVPLNVLRRNPLGRILFGPRRRASVPGTDFDRLLENGNRRLLEDGSGLLLEN